MRISRTETAGHTRRGADAEPADGRVKAERGPWTVVCAVATVVLGPAAVTASALDQANAAPMHQAARAAEQTQAYVPADLGRRRTAA